MSKNKLKMSTNNAQFDNNMDIIGNNNAKSEATLEKVTDLYSVLEVAKDATQDEIKESYLRLALIHHPDKGGDIKRFKEIAMAYKVLSDEKKKNKYDSSLAATYLDLINGGDRDMGYHKSDQYIQRDETGNIKRDANGNEIFDADAFNRAFNEGRTYKERDEFDELLKPIPKDVEDNKDVINTFESMLKARQMEEEMFISRDESLIFMKPDGKIDDDEFARIFNEKKRKGTKALADYDPSSCISHNTETFNNYLIGMDGIFGRDHVTTMNDDNYITPAMFTDMNPYEKAPISELNDRIDAMRKEQEYLYFIPKSEYIIDPSMVTDDLVVEDNIDQEL